MTIASRNPYLLFPAWLVACAGVTVWSGASDWAPSPDRPATDETDSAPCPRLRVFVHSRCPCARAALVTLDSIVPETGTTHATTVYVFDPDGDTSAWRDGPLGRLVASWPRAEVVSDHGAALAAQFGASASGTVLLVAADGKRLFSGGVTAGRGGPGPNPARASLDLALRAEPGPPAVWPVFGCEFPSPSTSRVPQ